MGNITKHRNFWLILIGDILLLSFAYYLSYYIRFDGKILSKEKDNFILTVIWIVPIKIFILSYFDLYKGMWRYTGIHDLINLIKASVISSAIIISVLLILHRFAGFSRGVFIIDFLLTLIFLSGYRIGVRLRYAYPLEKSRYILSKNTCSDMKKILIIGAGNMGEKLVREIMESPTLRYDVIGFIDDDPVKLNKKIHGVPVLGVLQELENIAEGYQADEIVIAISTISAAGMRRIVNQCKCLEIPFKTVPGIWEMLEGRINLNAIRKVRYEDLLGRNPVSLDMNICQYLENKKVMVTGGAGSIGSELCRQISRFKPEELIIVEKNESALYDMDLTLKFHFPNMKITSVLGPVQNHTLMENVFIKYQPDIVFHAAAYKHVPMMEIHPWEAVFNNVLGTQNILDMCCQHKVERFVLVSTDKAVRPTNVMGASKRVSELLVQAYSVRNHTHYMAVRFGNVVGSIGSVVPLFRKQIERGGPITVTHPEITRYFMTIPEACSLILQAGAIGRGGEIFLLKMGVPVRIADMARDMIRLSGFDPEKDIEIQYTGLRPGEKLYEELITEGEDVLATAHDKIMVLNTNSHHSLEEINTQIEKLCDLARLSDTEGIKCQFKKIAPEYMPQ